METKVPLSLLCEFFIKEKAVEDLMVFPASCPFSLLHISGLLNMSVVIVRVIIQDKICKHKTFSVLFLESHSVRLNPEAERYYKIS